MHVFKVGWLRAESAECLLAVGIAKVSLMTAPRPAVRGGCLLTGMTIRAALLPRPNWMISAQLVLACSGHAARVRTRRPGLPRHLVRDQGPGRPGRIVP